MSQSLPERADLEHLKNQAKALLKSALSGESSKLTALGFQEPFKLAHAQTAIARQYGFESWAKLKRFLESSEDRIASYFQAVRRGDRDEVQRLLKEDPRLIEARHKDEFDAPAINIAAGRNDRRMLELLLEHGADVNARSTWWAGGFGALDFADETTSNFLIAKGAKLTAHAAARLGLLEELRAIVRKTPGAVHERGGDGQFPLHFAKTPAIVDFLVDAGADVDARDVDHEATAVQWKIQEAAVRKRLLERGATPDIFTAVMEDDPELVEGLLKQDPGAATRHTIAAGNPHIPKAPGEHIYLYTIGPVQPHQLAHRWGKKKAWEKLWELADAPTRLGMAAWKGDAELASTLLEEDPALVSKLPPELQVLLPDAAWERRTSVVALMLELGWDVNAANSEMSTAVDRAAFHGFADVIEAILPHRPDLTVRNVYGGTPLSCCAYGSLHSWRKDGDFARSAELLIRSGSPKPERLYGSPEVLSVMAKHGMAE